MPTGHDTVAPNHSTLTPFPQKERPQTCSNLCLELQLVQWRMSPTTQPKVAHSACSAFLADPEVVASEACIVASVNTATFDQ